MIGKRRSRHSATFGIDANADRLALQLRASAAIHLRHDQELASLNDITASGQSLYNPTVGAFIHALGQVQHLLRKGEEFCAAEGVSPDVILQRRLSPDMHPFVYQVKSTKVHSLGAIEGIRRGAFSPDTTVPPDSFAGLADMINETRPALEAMLPEEIDALAEQDMVFSVGSYRAAFTGRSFLLTFSVPNFYFHLSTAYGLLRGAGVPVGKVDYLGRVGTRL